MIISFQLDSQLLKEKKYKSTSKKIFKAEWANNNLENVICK